MSGETMSDFVTALTGTNGLTADVLWGAVTSLLPFIVAVAGFGFAYYLIKKLIKGFSKGKVRM